MIQKHGTGVNFGWGQTQERSWAMRWTVIFTGPSSSRSLPDANFGKIEQRRNQKYIMRVLDTAAVNTDQQIQESMPTLTCWVCAWMCSYKKWGSTVGRKLFSVRFNVVEPCSQFRMAPIYGGCYCILVRTAWNLTVSVDSFANTSFMF